MKEFSHFFYEYFSKLGMSDIGAKYLNMVILVLATLLIIFIIDVIIRRILLNLFTKFSEKTKTHFDDYVVKNKVPMNVAHIIPLLIALEFVPFAFVDFPYFENVVE